MNRFKVPTTPPRQRVDEQALAAFSAGAESHGTGVDSAPIPGLRPVVSKGQAASGRPEKATESFLLRLTPSQMQLLNLVFERTNVKSRQKLVEAILIPELERRAAELPHETQ